MSRAYIVKNGRYEPAVVYRGAVWVSAMGELVRAGGTLFSPSRDRLEERTSACDIDELPFSES